MAKDILTVPEMLRHRSEEDGKSEAFTFYDRTGLVSHLTPKDIYTLSGKFASLLRQWGFHPGDVIANGLPNSPERIVTDFGISMAGCVLTNCQVLEKDGSDFWKVARKSKCRGVIIPARKDNPAYQIISPFLNENPTKNGFQEVTIPRAPSIQGTIVCDRTTKNPEDSLMGKLQAANDDVFEANCSPSDLAILFGTSGSSGFSKLVAMTHEKVIDKNQKPRASRSPIYFSDRPLGWIGGFPVDFLVHQTKRVLQDKFDNQHTTTSDGLWNIISTAQCVGAALLPCDILTLVDDFQNNPPEYKLSYIGTGAQPLKQELMKAIGLLCQHMVLTYGSTEAGIISMDVITHPDKFQDFYCGKIRDEIKLQIRDEEGHELMNGSEGEICLRGDGVSKEYYNQENTNSNLTEQSYTKDGWFRTGDRGTKLDDGSVYCYGRKGDIVRIGHHQIFLSWAETILMKCPLLLDASVLGVETDKNVTSLCACVIPKKEAEVTENNVIKIFNERLLDVEPEFSLCLYRVFIMDKLPALPAEKINKRKLKVMVMDRLKLPRN